MSEIEKLADELNMKLYEPRFCDHCGKVQKVRVCQLTGSNFEKIEGNIVTVGFTGSIVCDVCLKAVNK